MGEVVPDNTDWPALDLAYEFVRPSYDWTMRRFEAMEGRIHALVMMVIGFTTGVPTLAKALAINVDLHSSLFSVTVILAVAIVAIGLFIRVLGRVTLLNPKWFYVEPWRKYTAVDFKSEAIYWAGVHFEKNAHLLNKQGWALLALTIMFAAEALLMLWWVTTSL